VSHYTEIKNTQINDLTNLLKTLQKLGYAFKQNHFIEGHQRRRRVDLAVKIHGEYLVGFKKNPNNTYSVVADWSSAKLSSKKFISQLKQVYNTEKILHEAKLRGYSLIQQKVVNGGIRLVLRKVA
jgi:hypothetical protein